jgi:hypothetical protein
VNCGSAARSEVMTIGLIIVCPITEGRLEYPDFAVIRPVVGIAARREFNLLLVSVREISRLAAAPRFTVQLAQH